MLYHLFEIAIILVAIWVIPQIIFWVGGSLFIVFAIIYAFIGLGVQQWWEAMREAAKTCSEVAKESNEVLNIACKHTREF